MGYLQKQKQRLIHEQQYITTGHWRIGNSALLPLLLFFCVTTPFHTINKTIPQLNLHYSRDSIPYFPFHPTRTHSCVHLHPIPNHPYPIRRPTPQSALKSPATPFFLSYPDKVTQQVQKFQLHKSFGCIHRVHHNLRISIFPKGQTLQNTKPT